MDVAVSDAARKYALENGVSYYVRAHPHHCCTGALTMLDISTEVPSDLTAFTMIEADGVTVAYCGGASGEPHDLVIDLRGLRKRRPVAYWDGCAYKV